MGNRHIKKKEPMINVTSNIPQAFLNLMRQMVEFGLTPSVSEFIRQSVWDKLSKDLNLIQTVLDEQIEVPEYEGNLTPNSITMDFRVKSITPSNIYFKK